MEKIKVGIVGYGNLGKGVQYALSQSEDMEAVEMCIRDSKKNCKKILDIAETAWYDVEK